MKTYIYLRRTYSGLHDKPLSKAQKSGLLKLSSSITLQPFDFIDVGARGGKLKEHWFAFETEYCRKIAIEADSSAAKQLHLTDQYNVVLDRAVGSAMETKSLFLTKFLGCSSMVEPNFSRLELFPAASWFLIQDTESVEVSKLDDLLSLTNRNWLKLDVQGFEFDVLKGALKLLENTLFIDTEVQFYGIYKSKPLEALQLLADLDFVPVNISHDKFWWGGFIPEGNILLIKNPLTLSIDDIKLVIILLAARGERLAVLHILRTREGELSPSLVAEIKKLLRIRSDWTFPRFR